MQRLIKEEVLFDLYSNYVGLSNLVIGCGTGDELPAIAVNFQSYNFTGVDINVLEDQRGANWFRTNQDAHSLQFVSETFDFIYCYHVLEHVENPEVVLNEISRTLKNTGFLFIGTPNKSRLLGYFSSGTTIKNKIRWNLVDLKHKIFRKFENRYGAHAGFTYREMKEILDVRFNNVQNITHQYYLQLYPKHRIILQFLNFLGLSKYIYPSIYFVASF